MSDDIFTIIAKELETGKTDTGLWTRAFAECDGDSDKTKALYIRLRHADLSAARPPQTVAPATAAAVSSDGLGVLRLRLKNRLAETGKQSFYSLLGIPPDVSDAVVAAAIARLNSRAAKGETLSADMRQAMESLDTPTKREQYDRGLLSSLNPRPVQMAASIPSMVSGGEGAFDGFWRTKVGRFLILVIIAVVALMSVKWFSQRSNRQATQRPTYIVQPEYHATSTPSNESTDNVPRADDREAARQDAAQKKADNVAFEKQQKAMQAQEEQDRAKERKDVCKRLIDETNSAVRVRAYTELCAARISDAEFISCVKEMQGTDSAVRVATIAARCIGDPTAHARISPELPPPSVQRPLTCFGSGAFMHCN